MRVRENVRLCRGPARTTNGNFFLHGTTRGAIRPRLYDISVSRSEERRVGKEWRYWRDWSSDVCSSDLSQRFKASTRNDNSDFAFCGNRGKLWRGECVYGKTCAFVAVQPERPMEIFFCMARRAVQSGRAFTTSA